MVLAAVLFLAGLAIFIIPLLMTAEGWLTISYSAGPPDWWAVMDFLGLILLPLGVYLFNYGRQIRLAAKVSNTEAAPSSVGSIVYLRSFADAAAAGLPGADRGGLLYAFATATEEEQLMRVLSEAGPTIALGRPGESLPELGARRVYVEDAVWQSTITEWLKAARLTVLRVGGSAGLLWELEMVRGLLAPDRLVLLIPRDELSRLSDYASRVLGETVRLTEPRRKTRYAVAWSRITAYGRYSRYEGLAALVSFGPSWEPRATPLRIPFVCFNILRPDEPMFREAFKPVFERLGIYLAGPRFSWLSLGIVVAAIGLLMAPMVVLFLRWYAG